MITACAAQGPGTELQPFEYDPGPLLNDEVEIDVTHCGICHSDLSMWKNEWGMTQYPFVPGHEVVGYISAVGGNVTWLAPGDRVGLGWHSRYCLHCRNCLSGDHNLCPQAQGTIVGRHGGFANKVRAQAICVVKLPDSISNEVAGPLFCGGITVFNPMVQFNLAPTSKVAVIGIGGLGHMAVKFLNAWGCEVTAFTSSESKRAKALALGAHKTLNSRDSEDLASAANQFDLILSTVNVGLDWEGYLATLNSKGRLHFLGATLEPLKMNVFSLIMSQRSVSGSPVGSPATIAKMLDFADRHRLHPEIELFEMSRVNEALNRLEKDHPYSRMVLRNDFA